MPSCWVVVVVSIKEDKEVLKTSSSSLQLSKL